MESVKSQKCFSLQPFKRWPVILWIFVFCFSSAVGYYAHSKCFGTGDCIITAGYLGGGFNDEYHKWLLECQDGEAITGIYDSYKQFLGIAQIWCFFTFPLKPPSNGIYPFYPSCNVRNFTLAEYYCYDKNFPSDTVDTFTTGLFSPASADPLAPTLMKCYKITESIRENKIHSHLLICPLAQLWEKGGWPNFGYFAGKTPPSYKLDYNRCQWKYTHDRAGEHYDGYWIVKCDTNTVMTGMGQAVNPWDNQLHWVWIQCCPVVTVPAAPLFERSYNNRIQGSSYSFL